jgi:hypothetical protein
VGIEELDGALGDHQGSGGELAVVLEVEEVVADLVLADLVGWGVEVVGELPDGAEVGLLGPRAEAGQLEVLEHVPAECCRLAESRGHRQVLSQRSQEIPLQRSRCHGMVTGQGFAGRRESSSRGKLVALRSSGIPFCGVRGVLGFKVAGEIIWSGDLIRKRTNARW